MTFKTIIFMISGLFTLNNSYVVNQDMNMNRQFNPRQMGQGEPNVTVLVPGSMAPIQNGYDFVGAVSLVTDNGVNIMVDTPNARDNRNRDLMLQGLSRLGVSPSNVQWMVFTHGHADHFGQEYHFQNAKSLLGGFQIEGSAYTPTELRMDRNSMNLTPNVEIWNTPGHTGQCMSVIVHNTACCGTVAVVGDLLMNAEDAINSTISAQYTQQPALAKMNRNRVICASDYIIPGHGPMFRVTDQMRQISVCQGRLSANG